MNLNFKNWLQKWKYQFKMNPVQLLILMISLPGYVWMFITQSGTYKALYMAYMVFLVIIISPAVSRRLFYKPIGDSKIFVTRHYSNWTGIYQAPDKASLKAMSKEDRKKHLVSQKDLMDALPAGRYRTVTHDTVANRIKLHPLVTDYVCKPAYRANLKRIQKGILKDDKTLQGRSKQERQFYFIEFVKMQNPQDGS